jgi:hypothetical protein
MTHLRTENVTRRHPVDFRELFSSSVPSPWCPCVVRALGNSRTKEQRTEGEPRKRGHPGTRCRGVTSVLQARSPHRAWLCERRWPLPGEGSTSNLGSALTAPQAAASGDAAYRTEIPRSSTLARSAAAYPSRWRHGPRTGRGCVRGDGHCRVKGQPATSVPR